MSKKKEDVNIASYQTQELSKQINSLFEMFYHLMRLFKEEAQSNRKNEEEIKELKIKVELLTRLSRCCSKCVRCEHNDKQGVAEQLIG